MTQPMRVLMVDDHLIFLEAVQMLLAGEPDVEVLGAVSTAEEALELARKDPPDVALVDIDLPGSDGVQLTEDLRRLSPSTQVVVVTAYQDQEVIARAVRAGACGYVPKTQAAESIVETIHRARAGEIVLPSGDFAASMSRLDVSAEPRSEAERRLRQLTGRELQILQALADGRNTVELARDLQITTHTIQTHVKNVLAKLGVHSKLQAVVFAARLGVVHVGKGTS